MVTTHHGGFSNGHSSGGFSGGGKSSSDSSGGSGGSRYYDYYEDRMEGRNPTAGVFISFAFILFIFIGYVYTYKTSLESPAIQEMQNIQKTYVKASAIEVVIEMGSLIGMICFTKRKETLTKCIKILAIVSAITIIVMGIINLHINSKYTEQKFEEIYDSEIEMDDNKSTKEYQKEISKISGIKLSDEKKSFIKEAKKLQKYFKIESTIFLFIQIIMIGIELYLLYKLIGKNKKKRQLDKDDLILYDEEENIKM